jgi:glycine cleavage system protein P-like pyridoxal-binding family
MNGEPDYTSGNYAAFNEEPTETESESNIQEFIEIETNKRDINGNKIKKTSRKRRRHHQGGKKRSQTSKKRSMTGKKRSHKNR